MANQINSNTIYIDTTGNISNTAGILIDQVIITATSANAVATLADQGSGTPFKLAIRLATSGESKSFEFPRPIYIPVGLNAQSVTNCVLTVIYRKQGEA